MSGMRKKAKKKAEKDQNRGGNFKLDTPEGTQMFAPKSKEPYHLDILPYEVTVDTHPEVEKGELWYQRTYWTHFGLGEDGKKSAICPKTIGKPCPVCEYYKELVNSDDEDDREEAGNIKPKERELFNVIDLDNQDAGVQIFEYSYHLFGKALSEEINEGSEEEAGFAELEGGKTLKVSFRKNSIGSGPPFFEVRKITFQDREDYDEDWLEEVYDLDQLLIINSYKEMEALLHGTSSAEDKEGEEDEGENEKPKKKSSGKKGKKSSKPSDEDEEDENNEDEGDEDDKSKKKSSKKKSSSKKPSGKKGKKSKDEDEDEDEDKGGGKKKTSKRPGKSPTKKSKKNKCPGGGEFGVDTDQLDECQECDIWTECEEASESED